MMGFLLIQSRGDLNRRYRNGVTGRDAISGTRTNSEISAAEIREFYARPALISWGRRFKTMPSPETGVINVFTFDFGATRPIFFSSCDLW